MKARVVLAMLTAWLSMASGATGVAAQTATAPAAIVGDRGILGIGIPYWIGAAVIVLALAFLGWRYLVLKLTVRRLSERERVLSLLLNSVSMGYGVENLKGETIVPNEGLARTLGLTPSELQSMRFTEYTDPEFAEADSRLFQELAAGHLDRYEFEKRYLTRSGEEVWGRVTRVLLRDDHGNPYRCYGVTEDITDRKTAENALVAREAQLSSLIDGAPVGIFFKDTERRYLIVNQSYCEFQGHGRDEVIGHLVEDFREPEPGRKARIQDDQVLNSGEPLVVDDVIPAADGTLRHFSVRKFPITDADGMLIGLGGMMIEMTGLRDAERSVVELGERMHRILNAAGEGICELNMEGEVTFINLTGAAMLGWQPEELIGKRFHETVHSKRPDGSDYPFDDCPSCAVIKSAAENRAPNELFRKRDGEGIAVSLLASPIHFSGQQTGVVLVFEDVTERLSMERQLRQAQKMEAIGQLTGGVAHDFNNLLQVVESNLELARRDCDEATDRFLDSASRAVHRGADLTQKLLAFSRKQTLNPESLAVDPWLEGAMDLMARTVGEDIAIELALDAPDAHVNVDDNGLSTAFLNLVLNARAAMPRGGSLRVTTRLLRLDFGRSTGDGFMPPGRYVEIALADTGCGMSEDVLAQAFQPFFTTKDVGEGSGLGLSMVYGFARQSGGDVRAESRVGRGTTVRILLPLAEHQVERQAEPAGRRGHREQAATVLLVEDDPDVRAATILLLESLKCTVRAAETAAPVLDMLAADPAIDLLLSDVVLPGGQNGIELAEAAAARRPGLKVILVSGYPETALHKVGLVESGFRMLGKPFTRKELADAIAAAMAE